MSLATLCPRLPALSRYSTPSLPPPSSRFVPGQQREAGSTQVVVVRSEMRLVARREVVDERQPAAIGRELQQRVAEVARAVPLAVAGCEVRRSPLASMVGARPPCQIPPPYASGLTQKIPTRASVVASNAMIQP